MNITILGSGAYGIALSHIFKDNNNVTIWTKVNSEYELLTKTRCNSNVLPNYYLDKSIEITTDLKTAIEKAKIIVIAIPVKYINETILAMKPYYKKSMHICIASKGIEQVSYIFPYNIVTKTLNTKKVSVISGGTFAKDIITDNPLGLTIASKNSKTTDITKKILAKENVKIMTSKDVLGIEFWGAIKNIIAIGCGIVDGMSLAESTKSLFFTKCYNEITSLIYDLGGNQNSSKTYAGIGDLYLTCTSDTSRNYTFGKKIGSGESKENIQKYIDTTTIEGLYTLKSLYELMHIKSKKSSIITTLYLIIYKNENKNIIIDYLKK